LAGSVAAPISASLGVDVSPVRVHSGAGAAASAAAVGAHAFARGTDIVLGSSARASDLPLMAHEVAHVVQQQSAPRVQLWTPDSGDRYEQEANRAAVAVVAGRPFTVRERTTPRRQRVPSVLDYIADKANIIPGYRLLTVVLGVNPINMSKVEPSGANILLGLLELFPGVGTVISQVLQAHGLAEKGGNWLAVQFKGLGMAAGDIRAALMKFIEDTDLVKAAFNLEATWERAKRIFTEPVARLGSAALGIFRGLLTLVLDAIRTPIAKLAETTSGWPLLTAVLERNPITNEKVERNPETVIGGFLILANQQEILDNMKKSRALPKAWDWFQGAMKDLLGFVSELPGLALAAFKKLEFADILDLGGAFGKIKSVFGTFLGNFITWAGKTAWNLLEIIFNVVKPGIMDYVKKTGAALKSILKNPVPFVGNLVKAAKAGFQSFGSNFVQHLIAGLISWLTSSLPGVYIPKGFSFSEILKFLLSVLGISWATMRPKLVKVIGDKAMGALEGVFPFIATLASQGPAAAWEQMQEAVGNLKSTVIDGIKDTVVEAIKEKAIPKIVAMFVPGAGFIGAIMSIYDTITTFVSKLSAIGEVVAGFVNSIVEIAGGNIAAASKKVESVLAGLLPLAISFLASFAGLGKIPDKVMQQQRKLATKVDKGIDAVIAWIQKQAKKLLPKLTGKKDKAKKPSELTPEQKVEAAVRAAARLLAAPKATLRSVRAQLPAIQSTYSLKALTIIVERETPENYEVLVHGENSPRKTRPQNVKKGALEAMGGDPAWGEGRQGPAPEGVYEVPGQGSGHARIWGWVEDYLRRLVAEKILKENVNVDRLFRKLRGERKAEQRLVHGRHLPKPAEVEAWVMEALRRDHSKQFRK
jgi:transposase